MSFGTWHTYGYGFSTDELIPDSVDRMEALLEKAPEYRRDIHTWFEDCEITEPSIDDYLDFDEDYRLGLATILKEVIREATGLELVSCDSFDGFKYLLYVPLYPWQMTEKDKEITKEKIDTVFNEFVAIVTDTKPDIDFQGVENGG